MPTIKTQAVVLDSIRLGEADRLITFFTPDHGKVKAKARGIGKTRSRYGSASELFALDDLVFYAKRENQEIQTVTECVVLDPREAIRGDLHRLAVAAYCAEVATNLTTSFDPHPDLWMLLLTAAEILKAAPPEPAFPWVFALHALELTGHLPDFSGCQDCGKVYEKGAAYFDNSQGGILCRACHKEGPDTVLLSGRTLRWMGGMRTRPFEEAVEAPAEPGILAEIRRVIVRHCEYQFDWRSRSLEFMDSIHRPGPTGV